MANARGELMFFAFHDDVVAPTYVEKLVAALADNERAVLAFSDMEVHELDGPSSCTCSTSWRGSAPRWHEGA